MNSKIKQNNVNRMKVGISLTISKRSSLVNMNSNPLIDVYLLVFPNGLQNSYMLLYISNNSITHLVIA